jgi:hypothetical protein
VVTFAAAAPASARLTSPDEGTALPAVETAQWAGQPSSYVETNPPSVAQEMDRVGRVQVDTPLSFYPTGDQAAAFTQLAGGSSVEITGLLTDDNGENWYRTGEGDYLPAADVVFPRGPSMPGASMWAGTLLSYFGGNWIDVDLSPPATMTAFEGDVPVRTMYTIIGRAPLYTPTGTFSIIRRVANETMDSSTIGIPRDGPGGYYLTNVLFTQYFTSGGASIHYNYWSSNWGYPGSHGCLGLSYDDAAFMWDFADYGTLVSIHY